MCSATYTYLPANGPSKSRVAHSNAAVACSNGAGDASLAAAKAGNDPRAALIRTVFGWRDDVDLRDRRLTGPSLVAAELDLGGVGRWRGCRGRHRDIERHPPTDAD